jgi:mono/diheme cytochrome c family protein
MTSRPFRSAVLFFSLATWICSLYGQDKKSGSVWDGVYTNEQAARGQATYGEACASCHGEKLEGQGQGSPLTGSEFASNWNGSSVGDLLEKIQLAMPADRPGSLSKDKNASIVAYILKFNKFPAGGTELPASVDAIKGIRIEAKPAGK